MKLNFIFNKPSYAGGWVLPREIIFVTQQSRIQEFISGGGGFRNSQKMLGGVKMKVRGKKPVPSVKKILTPILSYTRLLAKKFNVQKNCFRGEAS